MSEGIEWVVVGISGVTCGGKTTLASALHQAFPGSVMVSQDTYFLSPDDPRHTLVSRLNHLNWELITALDMTKMVADIKEIITRPASTVAVPLLIIEGFLIFRDPYISSICDCKLFFLLTHDECWARRRARTYDPPDVPGYFQQVVWPEYTSYLGYVLDTIPDINLISGSINIQSVVQDYNQILTDKLNCKSFNCMVKMLQI